MRECTPYMEDCDYDDENIRPCSCPVCGGFLKWDWKEGEGFQPICNKCEYPLIAYPLVEDGEVIEGMGKICPIGKPNVEEVKAKIKAKSEAKKLERIKRKLKGNWDYCI